MKSFNSITLLRTKTSISCTVQTKKQRHEDSIIHPEFSSCERAAFEKGLRKSEANVSPHGHSALFLPLTLSQHIGFHSQGLSIVGYVTSETFVECSTPHQ